MKVPDLYWLDANIMCRDDFEVFIEPFSGIAFQSPLSGQWVGLRRGVTIARYLDDEVTVFSKRLLSDSRQQRLQRFIPAWFPHEEAQA